MLPRLLRRPLPSRLPPLTPAHSTRTRGVRKLRRPQLPQQPTTTAAPLTPDDISAPDPDADPGLLDDTDPLNLRGTRRDHSSNFRFYTQDVADLAAGKPAQRVSVARLEQDERTAEELWKRISKLEREVEQLERDDPLDATIMRLQAMERDLPDAGEDVEMLSEKEPESVRDELDALYVPVLEAEGGAAAAVGRLNNCLRHAFLATEARKRPVVRAELWKAYKRAKIHVQDLLLRIPDPAWDILFYSQAVRWKSNPRREEHVAELLEDLKSVGMDGPPTKPPGEKAGEKAEEDVD